MSNPPRKQRSFFSPGSRVPAFETPPANIPAAPPATPSVPPAPPASPVSKAPKPLGQPVLARDPRSIVPSEIPAADPRELLARQGVAPDAGFHGLHFSGRLKRRLRLIASLAVVALVAWGGGYWFGQRHAEAGAPFWRGQQLPGEAPTAEEQAALDAAFAALRSARYAEARQLFTTLVENHRRWASLYPMIALATLYQNDASGFKKYVEQSENNGEMSPADSSFLLAHYSLNAKAFADANKSFGECVGADPTRPQTYYFWGDCLMQWGNPAEAVKKFRTARLCNLYPTADNLYETRYWLAEIKSGLETSDGSAEEITRALAAERPKSSALFAGAGRAIKSGQFVQAAEYLLKTRQISDPVLFHVVLLDPSFYEERWRPEFKAIYAEEFPSPP